MPTNTRTPQLSNTFRHEYHFEDSFKLVYVTGLQFNTSNYKIVSKCLNS